MKIIAVQSKDVYITLELSVAEIRKIIDFSEKSMNLYAKVYQDDDMGVSEYIESGYIAILKQLLKEIDDGT